MNKREELLKLAERVETGEHSYNLNRLISAVFGSPDELRPDVCLALEIDDMNSSRQLHNELLPGWEWHISWRTAPHDWGSSMRGEGYVHNGKLIADPDYKGADVFAKTPATAWVAAILRALASMDELE